MTLKYYLLLLGMFVGLSPSMGQDVSIEAFTGIGSYRMGDLKKILLTSTEEAELPVKVVDNFPAYFYSGFQVGFISEEYETGARFSHYSTGGRTHYKDYSGEYRADININAVMLGLYTRMTFLESNNFKLKGSVAALGCFSYGFLEQHMRVWNEVANSRINVVSASFLLEPSIVPTVSIGKYFYFGSQLGAAFDVGGGLRLAENTEMRLEDERGEPIKTSWYGLRSELFIGLNF